MAQCSAYSNWLLVILAHVQLAAAVRWATAWTDLGLGGLALLSWADMGQSDALLELKSSYKDKITVLVKREVPPGTQHPYLFKLPNEDAVESGELQYDARYWFQVSSVETGESDNSPDYYLSRDNVLLRGPRPDGGEGDGNDDDNGSASSGADASRDTISSTAVASSRADTSSSTKPTETGNLSNNGDNRDEENEHDDGSNNDSRTGDSPPRQSGETDGSGQGAARTSNPGPGSTGLSTSENGNEDNNANDDNGDKSSLDDKTKIIIGVCVGLGGGGLLLLGVFCFVKRRKQRQRKSTQATGVERATIPELDNVEAKAKQELDGDQVHEKSDDNKVFEKDGGHALSELPGASVVVGELGDLHTDGRYGGRSEMAG